MGKKRSERNSAVQGTLFQGESIECHTQVIANNSRSQGTGVRGECKQASEAAESGQESPREGEREGHSGGEHLKISSHHAFAPCGDELPLQCLAFDSFGNLVSARCSDYSDPVVNVQSRWVPPIGLVWATFPALSTPQVAKW